MDTPPPGKNINAKLQKFRLLVLKKKKRLVKLSLSGFEDIAKAETLTGVALWILSMIILYSAAFTLAATILQDYLSKTTVIVAKTVEGSLQFPKITLCHTAHFNMSYLKENIRISPEVLQKSGMSNDRLLGELARYLSLYNPFANVGHFLPDLLDILTQIYEEATKDPTFWDLITDEAMRGYEIFRNYYFDGKPFHCAPVIIPRDIPSCYIITIKGSTRFSGSALSRIGEKNNGLSFEVDLPLKHASQAPIDNPSDYWLDEPGIRLHFNAGPGPMGTTFTFPGNTHAVIGLKYTEVNQLSDCYHDWVRIYDRDSYERDFCVALAIENSTWKMCGCRFLLADIFPKKDIVCTPRQMYDCVLKRVMATGVDDVANITLAEKKKTVCKRHCQTPSMMLLPASTTWSLKNESVPTTVRNRVTIYFLSSYSEMHDEKSIRDDIYTMFSNIGGLLGLYIGFSGAALAELMVFILLERANAGRFVTRRLLAQHLSRQLPIFTDF